MCGLGICFGHRKLFIWSRLVFITIYEPLYIVWHFSFWHTSFVPKLDFFHGQTGGQTNRGTYRSSTSSFKELVKIPWIFCMCAIYSMSRIFPHLGPADNPISSDLHLRWSAGPKCSNYSSSLIKLYFNMKVS